MQFVDERDGSPPGRRQGSAGLLYDGPNVFDRSRRPVQGVEFAVALRRYHVCQSRLARSRRSVEDQARQAFGLQYSPQHFARAEECILPEYVVDASGAHPHRQGRHRGDCGILRFPEEIHEGIVPDVRPAGNPRNRLAQGDCI